MPASTVTIYSRGPTCMHTQQDIFKTRYIKNPRGISAYLESKSIWTPHTCKDLRMFGECGHSDSPLHVVGSRSEQVRNGDLRRSSICIPIFSQINTAERLLASATV